MIRPPRADRAARTRMAIVLAGALVIGSCGGDGSLAANCDDVVTEALDPTWTVHLLPGAPEPEYQSDPPTSGPHYAAEPVAGTLDEPLDEPTQVTALEVGGVILQYRPDDLPEGDLGRLERLSDDAVVVAPDPDLPSAVVATAWVTKQECDGLDLDTLSAFVAEQGGQGPGVAG